MQPHTVVLPAPLRAALLGLAGAAEPNETCGLLSGRDPAGDGRWLVAGVHALRNVAARPRRGFRLDPVEQQRLTRQVEAAGAQIIGVFHSHPAGPGVPSDTDVAAAELLLERWCHLLVGADGQVRAWLLGAGDAGGRAATEVAVTDR